ncbi:MAG TPA: sigma-E factor regulatory protein RseB domain-containing protein [Chloroflexia bacterium]
MSEDFVRSELKEHLRESMPNSRDPWPEIRGRLQGSKVVRRSSMGSSLRPVAVIAGVALVLVLAVAGALLWPVQPKLVSAEAVIAEAEKVSKDASNGGLRSGHMVEHFRFTEVDRDSNEPIDSVLEGRNETWYQAPDKVFNKTSSHNSEGTFEASYFQIGDSLYQTMGSLPQINITTLREDAPRLFRPLDTKALYSTPPSFGAVEKPYEATLVGNEQILGRDAYVMELNVTPELLEAEATGRYTLIRHKYRLWIDQQYYLILKHQAWNKDGVLMDDNVIETLELNQPVDPALFKVKLAPGHVVADMRPASGEDVAEGWREVSKQVKVTLYEPGEAALSYSEARKPFYVESAGAVTQALVREHNGRAMLDAVVMQGPPSAIDESQLGSSTPMQVGSRQGRLYRKAEAYQLVFDVEGTRIMLYSSNSGANGEVESQLVKIANSLKPVGKK